MTGIRGLVFFATIVASVFTSTHAKGCKPCPLPTVNDRVCAKDGQTYPSKCYMKVKACVFNIQLKVAHKGSCVSQRRIPPRRPPTTTAAPTDPPTTTVMPTTTRQRRRPSQSASQGSQVCKACPLPSRNEKVCGIDGLTYPSKCYMKIKGCLLGIHVAVAHKGKCQRKTRPPPPRPRKTTTMPPPTTTLPPTTTTLPPTTTLRPTTARRAYRPEHPMSYGKLSIAGPGGTRLGFQEGDCGECPRPYASDAVCGSDSRTHPSVCWLDKLACITNTHIQPVHMGKCVSRTSSVVSVPEVPEVEPEEPEPRPTKTKPNRKEPKYSTCTACNVADYGPNDIACGSDGLDYPSSCHIELKACAYKIDLTVAHIGGCTDEEKPRRKKQTFTVLIPEREVEPTTPKLPPIFEPEEEETGSGNYELCGECPVAAFDDAVCGSDRKTYPSECNLQRIACLRNKDISIAFNGECPVEARDTSSGNEPCPSCSLPSSWEQVCGTDGQTHPSECLLNVKACIKRINLRVKHEGQCVMNRPKPNTFPEPVTTQRPTQRPIERCPTCPIPVPSDKVCGDDGVTYSSRCVLHRRACTRQIRTRLAHEGPCNTEKKDVNSGYIRCTNCPPPQLSDMVCGSDGMTYPSECFLEIKACIKRSSLRTHHTGKCNPRTPNPVITTRIRRPIPKTTPAPPSTTEAPASRWGESCSFECPITFNPVCGTDNLNYPSPCILESFACHLYNPALKVRHRGMCIRG